MKGILKESTIAVFANIKNVFKNIAIWTLIAGIVLAMILIMVRDDVSSKEIVEKITLTFFFMAISMLVGTLAAKCVDSKHPSSQVLALTCIVVNVVQFIMWTLAVWFGFFRNDTLSSIDRVAIITSIITEFCLISAGVMNIYEGTKKSTVLPLKLTAIGCYAITSLHGIVRAATIFTNTGNSMERFDSLAYFAGTAFFIVLVIALATTSSEKSKIKEAERKELIRKRRLELQQQMVKDQQQTAANTENSDSAAKDKKPKSDDELRAEIEEKVRREMIEKEVREKIEKEVAEKKAAESK